MERLFGKSLFFLKMQRNEGEDFFLYLFLSSRKTDGKLLTFIRWSLKLACAKEHFGIMLEPTSLNF